MRYDQYSTDILDIDSQRRCQYYFDAVRDIGSLVRRGEGRESAHGERAAVKAEYRNYTHSHIIRRSQVRQTYWLPSIKASERRRGFRWPSRGFIGFTLRHELSEGRDGSRSCWVSTAHLSFGRAKTGILRPSKLVS